MVSTSPQAPEGRESPAAGATSRQLLSNSVSSYARLLGTFAIGLIITPYLLRRDHMGIAGFGLFALLMSSVGIINILQQTVRAALVRELSHAYLTGDPKAMRSGFTAALVSSVMLGVGLGALMLAGTPLAMMVFQFGEEFTSQMWWSWITLSLFTTWVVVTVPFITLFDATHRIPLRNLELLLERVAALAAAIIVFSQPWGRENPLIAYIAGNCALTALVRLVCAAWAYLTCPNAGIDLRLLSRNRLIEIFRTGGHVGQSEIATNLYDRTNQVLVNIFLGPTLNGLFGVVVLLVGYTKQIAMGISFGVEPMAAKFSHNLQSGKALIGGFVLAMTRVQAGVIFPVVAVLIVLGEPLIETWLGEHSASQRFGANRDMAHLLNILLLGSPFFVIMQGPLRIMLGAGDVRAYASRLLLTGVVQAILAVLILWLVPPAVRAHFREPMMLESLRDGSLPVVSGLLVAECRVSLLAENAAMYAVAASMSAIYLVVYGLYIPILACALYDLRVRDMYLRSLLPGAAIGIVVGGALWLARWLFGSWTHAGAGAAILAAASLSAILFWTVVLSGSERARLREMMSRRRTGS